MAGELRSIYYRHRDVHGNSNCKGKIIYFIDELLESGRITRLNK